MAEKITGNDELKRQREEYEKIISKISSEKKAYEQVYRNFESMEKNIKAIESIPKLIFIKGEAEIAVQDKRNSKKSNRGEENKAPISQIFQEVSVKIAETVPQMGAVQATSMNLELYLAKICGLLQTNNTNNVVWNSLNNVMLSSIHSAVLRNNSDIVSLRDGVNNIKGVPTNSLSETTNVVEDDKLKTSIGDIISLFGGVAGVVTLVAAEAPIAIGLAAVAAVSTIAYYGGDLLTDIRNFFSDLIKGEKTTQDRWWAGSLSILNPFWSILSTQVESRNEKTGEISKYGMFGNFKESSYNPNTGIKKTYGFFGNVKSEEKIPDMPDFSAMVSKGTGNLKVLADAITKTNANQLNPMTRTGILASQIDARANTGLNPAANLPLNMQQGGGIEEKLALMQSSSTENMNALALLWDSYLQKVSLVYDMIIMTMNMKHMLMTMNTLLTILNLYLTWLTLPPMLEGVWQQILSSADAFLSNLKSKFTTAISEIKQKMAELSSVSINPPSSGGAAPGKTFTGSNFWKGGLTYVGERGRELIQYPTGERFMAEAKMLMNLPKGTKIFRNSITERMMNNGFSGNNMMSVDENNQLKKLGGFNGLSDYTDSKFGGGISYSSVKANNITINITNTYGNQSSAQIKDTNNDLVRKINDVLFQKEDRKRRVSIG